MAHIEEAGTHRSQDRSIPRLLRDFLLEATALFRDEVSLARSEVTANIAQLRSGLTLLGAGVVVLVAGLVVLLDGIVVLIAPLFPAGALWVAPLLVGLAVTAIGVGMLIGGGSKVSPRNAVPHQTIEETRRDREMLKETM